jgi:hypothetical protein
MRRYTSRTNASGYKLNKSRQLERVIQGGLLVLITLMPFHAFLSVWLGSITGHQAIIQAWKEILLLLLAAVGAVLLIRDVEARDRLRTWPVMMAGLFALIALIVTAATRPSLTATAFGAKTDLEFLLAFVLAIVAASPGLVRRLVVAVLTTCTLVVGFGLLQVFVLPPNFLTGFGYGPDTIAPYQTVDPAIKSLRFASTLGGPNQLGTFLLLPMALAGVLAWRRHKWWCLAIVAGGAIVLVHTYSRAAWLGATTGAAVLILTLIPARSRIIAAAALAGAGVAAAFIIAQLLKTRDNLQYYIFHGNALFHNSRGSDYEHMASLRQGLTGSLAHPLGHGLGTAGPAVFHSGAGPVIENNYLQIAYETGLPGALAFILVLAATGRELAARAARYDLAAAALAALVGISITALFLPAWSDSSTALIFWICAGSVIGITPSSRHV